jgi:N-acetylmuramoyl-L-alanine amidase
MKNRKMRRGLVVIVMVAIAAGTYLFAQTPEQATIKTPQSESSIATLELNGQLFVAADEFVRAMGGTIAPDGAGYKIEMLGRLGAFAPDNQYGVVRDELIQMPALPVVIEARPFVPWQFFRGYLASASDLDLAWAPQQRLFTVSQKVRASLTARISIVEIESISKVVIQLSGPTEYSIARRNQSYVVRFANPIEAPFSEQAFANPHVAKVSFRAKEVELQLTGPDVAGSAYRLDDPFRVVIDLKKGVSPPDAATPGAVNLPSGHVPGIRTIVIDPGHGGTEVGALGAKGMQEKDLTLALAKRLAAILTKEMKARVILTRETDEVVPLTQRTAIANQYQADLFISIHLNSSLRKGARGTETYFLSLEASDELAKQAAERENESESAPAAPDPSSDLKLMLWELAQQQYLKDSSDLAETVQDELSKATGTENRGVKQAPFRVLIGATMPAVLVEVGFISNPEEEAKLLTEAQQELLAQSIYRAVVRYKAAYESRVGSTHPESPAAPVLQTAPAPQPAPATTTKKAPQ